MCIHSPWPILFCLAVAGVSCSPKEQSTHNAGSEHSDTVNQILQYDGDSGRTDTARPLSQEIEHEQSGGHSGPETGPPDTIEVSLHEYSISNRSFRSIVDSISEAMRSCPEYNFGSIGAQRTTKGVFVELTIEDQNTIGQGANGYINLHGRTFALFGAENLRWLEKSARTRSFQYFDYKGIPAPYDPPVWYFVVRGDSIYSGEGSSFPCE